MDIADLERAPSRASPQGFGFLAKHPIEEAALLSYVLPAITDAAILHDVAKVIRTANKAYVQAAAQILKVSFEGQVMFAWPPEDKFFPLENAWRYAKDLLHARVELISDAYSFTPEDQPFKLAAVIKGFVQ